MPKQKSNSAAKKRFRVRPNGQVKRACAGKAHMANSKRRKNIRNLNKGGVVFEGEAKTIKLLVQKGMK